MRTPVLACLDNPRVAVGPVNAGPCEQSHPTIAGQEFTAVAVMFNFMHEPCQTRSHCRRFISV